MLLGMMIFLISCDTPRECNSKAKMMGLDTNLCQTLDNREMISSRFHKFSREKINASEKSKQINLTKEIQKLVDKISELEAEVLDCQERLAGTTCTRCDIPQNMPPPLECDCKNWRK